LGSILRIPTKPSRISFVDHVFLLEAVGVGSKEEVDALVEYFDEWEGDDLGMVSDSRAIGRSNRGAGC
jgi:hypothetical protein